jgi:serine/threonine protein kinase
MSARTEPAGWPQPRTAVEDAAIAWLDAVAGGICTPEAFLHAMQEQFLRDRDKGWGILSLLDQYYRRGKIKPELFQILKSRLESSALNSDENVPASVRSHVPAHVSPAAVAPSPVAPGPVAPGPVAPSAVASSAAAPSHVDPSFAGAIGPALAATVTNAVASNAVASNAVTAPAAATSPKQAQRAARPQAQEVREIRDVAIGDLLRGRYRVRGILGQGGMGTVFEAIDEYRLDLPTSGQRIAIKVLHTEVTHREELLAELQREFQHLQLLSHPNIVRVHEFDRDGDNAFFTMELLNGALLSGVIDARNALALPRPYALAIMREVGAALAHAHSRGVVHGDINPQNIFITNNGELRVLDFGASHKLVRDTRTAASGLSQRAPFATPGYASCQLIEGQQPDARDDLFAFACVAYILLSGEHPFPNRTATEARAKRVRPSRPPGLTGQQWRVLREGLRWERERRPADVQKWLDRFNLAAAAPHLPHLPELVDAPPPRKHGVVLAAVLITVFALIAAGGYWVATNYDSLAARFTPATPAVTQAPPPEIAPPSEMSGSAPAPRATPTPAPSVSAPAPRATPAPAPSVSAAAPRAIPTPAPSVSAPTNSTSPMASAPNTMAAGPTAGAPAATAPAATAPPANAPAAAPPAASPRPRAAAASPPSPGRPTDNAGPVRVEMVADTVDVPPDDQAARVTVRRRGSLHGDASFRWWTESGTAKPGRDFTPVIPRVEHIADGSGSINLTIPVLSTPRGKSKSFYVVIDQTESGGTPLGARTLTMVTMQPPD